MQSSLAGFFSASGVMVVLAGVGAFPFGNFLAERTRLEKVKRKKEKR